MAHITIEPVTADRFDDAEHALSGGGDGRSCQCQWWTLTNAEWQKTSREERRTMLHDEVDAGPPPALIAYVDGEPAGWVRVGPRTRQVRLARTRNFASHSEEEWDDPDVWAVSCFVVRKEHRREGLNAQLLDAAIDFARRCGARVLEAYPRDPERGPKKPANELFHGVVSTFEGAGFREVARPRPDLAIMSLDLTT
ncbi:GNAT family N-acetyltransferase [Microbacterium allomyrinae]|jgi:GNAT superfamily N-acetyltransferase|uniref:GNAT family N-acetyltransferase n=1 Tax=Microbacterium allomyrinae TaxID=2830666 RepID=A0A9X1LTQ7_9MICO|nr:GNAT family N-acetyltransferase [Microbacterium allomyrinae]MCC2031795.1 GNAT family N-acetyltransferase [Microbacterium allomyrinae]